MLLLLTVFITTNHLAPMPVASLYKMDELSKQKKSSKQKMELRNIIPLKACAAHNPDCNNFTAGKIIQLSYYFKLILKLSRNA